MLKTICLILVAFAGFGHANVPQNAFWRATLELTPGAHELRAQALHPFGLFTAYATNYFTNSGPSEVINDIHDGSGRITARIWKTGSTTNLTETWSWDAKGRLWKIVQRDATQSGFDETHVYDPLGRRLQTTRLPYISGVAISNSTVTTRQVYDPQHEFLELGASRNSVMMWKLYGPDLNGVYGSLNGLGGFEAIIPAAELFCPVISDSLGNLHGLYDQNHATFEWFSTRVTAFGSVPGYEPLPYAQGAPSIAHASAWRGKWLDDIDRSQWGVRPYLMDSARFGSPEPLWPNGNETPYSAWNGRMDFDADGRLATGIGREMRAVGGVLGDAAWNTVTGTAAGVNWLAGAAAELSYPVLGIPYQPFYSSMEQWQNTMSPFGRGGLYNQESQASQALGAAAAIATPQSWLSRASSAGTVSRLTSSEFNSFAANTGTRTLQLPATRTMKPGVLGETLPNGQVFLSPGLSRAEQVSTLRHESVHAFFSPTGNGPVATFRQNLGQFAYDNSQLVRFSEEVAAQTYATGSLRLGIQHGFNPYYQISVRGLATEGSVYGSVVGGSLYLGTQLGGER